MKPHEVRCGASLDSAAMTTKYGEVVNEDISWNDGRFEGSNLSSARYFDDCGRKGDEQPHEVKWLPNVQDLWGA